MNEDESFRGSYIKLGSSEAEKVAPIPDNVHY